MSNIVEFKPRKKVSKASKYEPMNMTDIENWLQSDIQKLMKNTGKDKEEVIKMASDFYYKYPALIEHVRSEEFMASRK
jgi:gluconate kinase